jgi:hypothetical protein
MGHAWLSVCQRVVKGKLGTAGTVLDSQQLHEAFMEEFRKQLKAGRKELRTGSEPDANLINSRKLG